MKVRERQGKRQREMEVRKTQRQTERDIQTEMEVRDVWIFFKLFVLRE